MSHLACRLSAAARARVAVLRLPKHPARAGLGAMNASRFDGTRALGTYVSQPVVSGEGNTSYGWPVVGSLVAAAVCGIMTTDEAEAAATDGGRVRRGQHKMEENYADMSTIHHVFKFYASQEINGEKFMTESDFVCALTPYVSQLIKERNTRKIRTSKMMEEVVKIVDANNDGHISFDEYAFFVAILRMPLTQLPALFVMFDEDGNGTLDADEFIVLVDALRKSASRGSTRRVTRDHAEGILKHLFSKQASIDYTRFVQFRDFLRMAVLRHEFSIHDKDQKGYLSPFRFARAVLSFSHTRHLLKYQERASRLLDLDGKITFKEYVDFQEVMKEIQTIYDACIDYGSYGGNKGVIVKSDFTRAARNITGVELSDLVVDIIFDLFADSRGDTGELELSNKFVNIMMSKHASEEDTARERKKEKQSIVQCVKNCFSQESEA